MKCVPTPLIVRADTCTSQVNLNVVREYLVECIVRSLRVAELKVCSADARDEHRSFPTRRRAAREQWRSCWGSSSGPTRARGYCLLLLLLLQCKRQLQQQQYPVARAAEQQLSPHLHSHSRASMTVTSRSSVRTFLRSRPSCGSTRGVGGREGSSDTRGSRTARRDTRFVSETRWLLLQCSPPSHRPPLLQAILVHMWRADVRFGGSSNVTVSSMISCVFKIF